MNLEGRNSWMRPWLAAIGVGIFKVDCRNDALEVVRVTSTIFFVIAAFKAVVLMLLGAFGIGMLDPLVYATVGFLLGGFHSRAAVVALLLLAAADLALILAGYGGSALLPLITLNASGRALEATIKLHGRFSAGPAGTTAP